MAEISEKEVEQIVTDSFKDRYNFDPFTILMIVGIVLQAIQIIQKCKLPKSLIRDNARREGLAYRLFVRKNIYEKLIEKGMGEEQALKVIQDLKKIYLQRWL